MFLMCLCWFLRPVLGHVIPLYLPSSSSILLGSPPDPYHVILVSLCLSVHLPCLCWFEYCLMTKLCISVLCACSSSSPVWPFPGMCDRIIMCLVFLVNHSDICGRHMCCPVCPINHAVPCCSHQSTCLGVGSPLSSSVNQGQLSGVLPPPQLWPPSSQPLQRRTQFQVSPVPCPCTLLLAMTSQ